ncbi:MAG: hypothetical protein Q8L77_07485 [Nitrospirota bacterium]|nr:hypothetical protein [Nitrospirota bacterium]
MNTKGKWFMPRAILATLALWASASFGAEDIIERAVPIAPNQLTAPAIRPIGPLATVVPSLEQHLAQLEAEARATLGTFSTPGSNHPANPYALYTTMMDIMKTIIREARMTHDLARAEKKLQLEETATRIANDADAISRQMEEARANAQTAANSANIQLITGIVSAASQMRGAVAAAGATTGIGSIATGAAVGAGASAGNAGAAAGIPGASAGAAAGGKAAGAGGGAAAGGSAGAARGQLSIEQQVGLLQQQVSMLQTQLAMLQAAVQVTPSGVKLQGPTVTILGGVVTIEAQNNVALRAGSNVDVRTGVNLSVSTGGNTSVQTGANLSLRSGAGTLVQASAPLDLKGSMISLNGGTKPLATVGSHVQVTPGSSSGQIVTGSPTILGN